MGEGRAVGFWRGDDRGVLGEEGGEKGGKCGGGGGGVIRGHDFWGYM